jgi:hypothetical protein
MEHVDWVSPDDIVLAKSTSDSSKKMVDDIYHNNIKQIRLLKTYSHGFNEKRDGVKSPLYFFRYVVGMEINWLRLGNPDPRKGVYYTAIYPIDLATSELNNLYKEFDREEKLNKLFGI